MNARSRYVRCALVMLSLGATVPLNAQAETVLRSRGEQVPVGRPDSQPTLPPLRRLVTLDFTNARLEAVLDEIDRQARVGLQYTPRTVPVDKRVNIRVTNATVSAALGKVLRGTGVVVVSTEAGDVILVQRSASGAGRDETVQAAVGIVYGVVTDSASGEPVPNAIVRVKGTTIRAATSERGQYQLREVPSGPQVIMTRLLGYLPLEKEVMVEDDRQVRADFALSHGLARLQEVVITATGRQRRLEIANSVTIIQADSIVRTQPIKDLTDLLTSRVPGLAVLPTTGAPGDPSRLRLRGSSSILRSNDPILIVDGVRVYSEQSEARNASLAPSAQNSPDNGQFAVGAPSALDRIDPNSIETVEVLNGPSAATLYGADAANGVIVVTTKRGRPGPARWDFSTDYGVTYMPGRFPETYFGFGHSVESDFADCSLGSLGSTEVPLCVVDSVVAYQALNDPELTVLGKGYSSSMSATVSGGRSDITYSVTGSLSDEIGLLKLPDYEAERYEVAFSRAPEGWMRRPHRLKRWSLASRFGFQPAQSVDFALTMGLAADEQQRSNLEGQLGLLRQTYVNKTNGLIYPDASDGVTSQPTSTLVPDFYRRTINRALGLRSGVNASWRPYERFTVRADAGLSADLRRDESVVPPGLRLGIADSLGYQDTGQGIARLGTLSVGANYDQRLRRGFQFNTAIGFNFTSSSVADVARATANQSGSFPQSSQSSSDITSYGWYVEPRLGNQRLFLSTGLRIDGGSNYGARASGGFKLPKLGFSWLISDEPFFPLKNSRLLNALRVRAAYGQAAVQPGQGDRFRLRSVDHHIVGTTRLTTLGNTRLRPERSSEIEGGFEADMIDNRFSVSLSGYRKTKHDAHLVVPVAPSVGGPASVLVNIGVVRNTGLELSLRTDLLTANPLRWSMQMQATRNRNVVVSLADGLESFNISGSGPGQRVVPGYPIFGHWERPLVGYADANGDGRLQNSEIVMGDSMVFRGAPEPNYTAALHTTVGLFRGALTMSASVDYQDGFAQKNASSLTSGALARAKQDPLSAPLAHQALALSRGLIQTVSTLRFHSLSIGFLLPTAVVERIGARSGTMALQGTNLGLVTNYRGKDPLVNSIATGNAVLDAGALPQPRNWQVRLSLSY